MKIQKTIPKFEVEDTVVDTNTMIVNLEYTDTFGGEPNYSWVSRKEITLPEDASNLSIVRAAKKAMGLSGVRCRRENFGDMLALYPAKSCTVLFITFDL